MPTPSHRAHELVYRIDASDVITYVDDAWVEFARQNDAESLTRAAVLGRSLWPYVWGVETRHIYQQLFGLVRSGRTVTIPFRCDSPELRRFHEMRMTSLDAGGIELGCTLLRQETRTAEPTALLDTKVRRGGDLMLMCSWCKRIRVPEEGWLELDRAVDVLDLLSESLLPQISHAICESCAEVPVIS